MNIEDALKDIAYYDGYNEVLSNLADDIEKHSCNYYTKDYPYSKEDMDELFKTLVKWDSEMIVFWELLVLMFGNYGTSPRSGWIEKKEDCIKYIVGQYD